MGILIIGGPTATGKTDIALALAEHYGAAIVSADAMMVYRGMDIGTAKPSKSVLSKFPHACVDIRDPDEEFTVADFVEAVQRVCRENQNTVIAGGTPFYLAALVRPLSPLPSADHDLRTKIMGEPDLYERLSEVDPILAARIHPNDRVRIVRGLEVFQLTGIPLSELQSRPARQPPIDAEMVWLDREGVRERIRARLKWMVEQGYIGEVSRLLDEGWSPDLKPMKSFAYRHLIDHLRDNLPLDEAIRRTERDTWRLARKQRTWARGMGWGSPATPEHITARAAELFQQFR